MGLGEGSRDAAPLSGSRGLSSGWAHQSSLGKVSSRISEIMERGIGKGDAMQGRLLSTAQPTREAGGSGRDREFTLYLPVQEARSTESWQSTQAATPCFPDVAYPAPGSAPGAELSAQPERGCPAARLLSLGVFPTGTCCRGSEITGVLGGRLGFGIGSGRVWLPEAWLRNWLSH